MGRRRRSNAASRITSKRRARAVALRTPICRTAARRSICSALESAAGERGFPLQIVDLRDPAIHELYQMNLVLVRPDGHVAWRSDAAPRDAGALLDRVRGVRGESSVERLRVPA
jgi:hypothetical protein